jgi:sigma-B regulation protein RsbU (phosphoserine phosphatase)
VTSSPSSLHPSPPGPVGGERSGTDRDRGADSTPSAPRLSLTDFLDVATLQEVQDSFTAVTRLVTTIRDADGHPVTAPTDARSRALSDRVLDQLIEADGSDAGSRFIAPIVVEGQELGSITIEPQPLPPASIEDKGKLHELARRLRVPAESVAAFAEALEDLSAPNRAASIQFLFLLANSIARLCYDEYHTRQRVEELSVLYRVSTVLSAHRDLQVVLDTAAQSVADVMKVKAVSIRLLKQNGEDELMPRAVFNLSSEYLNKGALKLSESDIFRDAMAGKLVYVEDMASDSRVLFPEDAAREGLVSMLCAGMIFQGKPIGTVQLFTGEHRRFTDFEHKLVRAITQLLGAAIENTRLDQQRMESQRMVRQLHLAADVQKRMLPGDMPNVPPFELAARYVPSFELGGDFYDFIDLDGNLGIAVGDVVGKGVAASLLMASVRASLRAYAQDVYDLDEIISRVNIALCRDTLDNEFATLWYGVFDPRTLRLTYCNAGHEPPMLVRGGKAYQLDVGGMIVGVERDEAYDKGLWDLEPGDIVLLYTDGLTEAMNFQQQKFGRKRIEEALLAVTRRPGGASAADVLNHVLWEMRRFTGLRRSIDDTTLVVLKVGPKKPA